MASPWISLSVSSTAARRPSGQRGPTPWCQHWHTRVHDGGPASGGGGGRRTGLRLRLAAGGELHDVLL
eukprot:6880515-Pyramimonas_sp.AAC.1